MKSEITRRTFLQQSSLVVAVTALSGKWQLLNISKAYAGEATAFKPHAFVEIAADETVTVWLGQTNLGQGTHTGISMIIAEELDADWNRVTAKMALAGKPFYNPHANMQFTGGSTSIRHRWDMLRQVGAAARLMLVQAAAGKWGIDPGKCTTEKGQVIHPDGRTLSYGALTAEAAHLPVPENPKLKKPSEYRIIGSARKRLDIPDKVAGKTKFGIDTVLPNMCIAVVARPPSYGAKPESFDSTAAMAVPGVIEVVDMQGKIAVCAETTYSALQGRWKLNVQWSKGTNPELDDAALEKLFQQSLEKPGAIAEDTGNVDQAFTQAETILEGTYSLPYISHAQLEPLNCTAHVEKDRCRLWIPTQGQTIAQKTAAEICGLPMENVEVMTTPAGGGFGLRVMPDPVIDSVTLSKKVKRPVKVMWTREDDFATDYLRPASVSTIKASLDANGSLTGWRQKVASPSIMSKIFPDQVKEGIDDTSIQGIPDMVYSLPDRRVEYVLMDVPVPIGFWRSVGYSITTFTVETFMDELAEAAGKDPVQFRLEMLKQGSRPYRTLSLLAEKTGWNGSAPPGRGRGMALGSCFGSSAAHMAEVSVDAKTGWVRVHKIVCAIDCGPAVYPDAITAQMEGAAVMALSTALHEKVHFAAGGTSTANFDGYRLLTMSEVPEIEVHIAQSNDTIGGIGEPGIPTVAPAVANAIFKVTGVRLRELPFQRQALISA